MDKIFIRVFAGLLGVISVFFAYCVTVSASGGFAGGGFNVSAIPHCSCEAESWKFQSTTHYLVYAVSFLIAFLAAAGLATRTLFRPAWLWLVFAFLSSFLTALCFFEINAC